ncbi:MAG TPA: hypothetical protein VLC12_12020 [Terriglobales bacterium]|jgi:hypothetical protein|nr:hypothetical protein [Terriglobales bacterium]
MYDYLQPGVVVKDRAGIRKAITRIAGDKVYWIYSDRSDRRQHAADYERFIDTHFIIADAGTRLPQAA